MKQEASPKTRNNHNSSSSRLPLHHLYGAAVALLSGTALLFLVLPLIVLMVRAVINAGWQGAASQQVVSAISLSAYTTAWTIALTVLFGTPLAFCLARWQFRFKRLLSILVELPIVLPPAVAGLGLLLTFGRRGTFGGLLLEWGISLPFSTAAVIMAQTFVAAPFFIRSAQVGFQGVSHDLEDAARVDGANNPQLFFFVTLPLAKRALSAGLALSWARALGEFGATILFAGSLQGRTQTMPLLVYNALERDLDAAIWSGVILILLATVALVLSRVLLHHEDDQPANI